MDEQTNTEAETTRQQPGTKPMNPGDEAPAGTPGTGESLCPACGGSGKREGQACEVCGGTGVVIEGVGGA